jgi:uncharacterized protein YecE (DUF72 family)
MPATCLLGCASWSLPRDVQERFPGEGQHLHRYASRFPAVEINVVSPTAQPRHV